MDILYFYGLFLLVISFFGSYFLFCRLRVGLLSIYFFSMVLYFLPLFVLSVYDPVEEMYVAPAAGTYVCSAIAVLGMFPAIFWERCFKFNNYLIVRVELGVNKVFVFFASLACLLLVSSLLPSFLSSSSKQEIIDAGGIELVVVIGILPIAIYVAYMSGSKFMLAGLLVVASLVFLFGSRSVLVFIFIAMSIKYLSDKRIVLIGQYKIIFLGALFLLVIVGAKTFYGEFVLNGLSGVEAWFVNFEPEKILLGAEFLATSAILNEVIVSDFSIPFNVVPISILNVLPVPSDLLGMPSSVFNDMFQPALFPEINYGMAYNPWAEAYSWLGYEGVFIYSVCIPLLIVFFERIWMSNIKNPLGAVFLVLGVTLAFWVHRNSLGSIFAYIRNAFYPALFLFFISCAIVPALKKRKVNRC